MSAKRKSLPRASEQSIDDTLDGRLFLYALAASATLAWSTPSHAQIVFTPSNAVFQGLGRFDTDLDHDGSTDFSVLARWAPYDSSNMLQDLFAYGNRPSHQIVTRFASALALKKNTRIGPGQNFRAFAVMESPIYGGYWQNAKSRCLGVRFLINGELHYGWIGFREVHDLPVAVKFYGWAYESVPDKEILAGDTGTGTSADFQPTSLEILATGHTGIGHRRKRAITTEKTQ